MRDETVPFDSNNERHIKALTQYVNKKIKRLKKEKPIPFVEGIFVPKDLVKLAKKVMKSVLSEKEINQ